MTAPEAAPGQIIGARYAVQGLLQHHGLSVTYHALTAPHREVAVKLFDPELRVRSEAVAFLKFAVARTNALPGNLAAHIVDHGFDPESGAPFTVTDFSSRPSLLQLVALCPLSKQEASSLLGKLSHALGTAHAQGLSHLSLKPANLFVGPTPDFETKVADFGATELRRVLSWHVPLVDVPWIAAEQLLGQGGQACDIFSTGLVLFFALTGRSYWRSCQATVDLDGWKNEVRAERAAASVRARELGVDLGTALDDILARALALDPGARFRSMAEFAAAFAQAVGTQVSSASRVPAATPAAQGPAAAATLEATADQGAAVAATPVSESLRAEGVPRARKPLARRTVIAIVGAIALATGAVAAWAVANRWTRRATVATPLVASAEPEASSAVAASAALAEPAASMGASGDTVADASVDDDATLAAEGLVATFARDAAARGDARASAQGRSDGGIIADASSSPMPLGKQAGPDWAQLTVRCVPECDVVLLDNKKVDAKAPLSMPAGTHFIAAARNGYTVRVEKITMGPGQKHTLALALSPQRAATATNAAKPCGKFLKRCN